MSDLFDGDIEEVTWRLVPTSLRPNYRDLKSIPVDALFIVKQDWDIELVGLNKAGKLDVRKLDTNAPMLYAELN